MKNLYYELQVLDSDPPKRLRALIGHLKKLGDKLGANQDIAMLKHLLLKTPNAFGGADNVARVVECLDNESEKLKRKSRVLGKAIFAKREILNVEWPASARRPQKHELRGK